MKYTDIKKKYPSLEGKKIAVIGSTGGIGRELCKFLAVLGAELVLPVRNVAKLDGLIAECRELSPHLRVNKKFIDLEDADSVVATAEELKKEGIDHLVLCAGAYHIPRKKCASGNDNIFEINFLSPYLLARELKRTVEAAEGRVVAVSSISYALSKFDPADPEHTASRGAMGAYGNAKRALTFSLFRLFDGSTALSVVHPGISPTGITDGYPAPVRAVVKYPMKLIFMSPKKAALSVLQGIYTPTAKGQWIGPRALGVWGLPSLSRLRGYSDSEADLIAKFIPEINSAKKSDPA